MNPRILEYLSLLAKADVRFIVLQALLEERRRQRGDTSG